MFAAPRDEADVVNAIVDRAVGHVVADVRSQQTHDVELGQGEVDIDCVPECSADPGLECQPSELLGIVGLHLSRSLGSFNNDTDTLGEDLQTARLVNEVKRTPIKGKILIAE